MLQINVASLVEDVLQQHGKRLSDIDLASRKAHEACKMLISSSFCLYISVCHFIDSWKVVISFGIMLLGNVCNLFDPDL